MPATALGDISGTVFNDYNSNGAKNAGGFVSGTTVSATDVGVQGVTVRAYDASGTLVGTAVTDAKGLNYFNSDVTKPASGDGTNIGGGLVAGQAFTIKLDKADDFTGSGPLAGYSLTKVNQTTTREGSQSDQVNSKATTVAGHPTMDVVGRKAGFNWHGYDAGFVKGGDQSANETSALAVKVLTQRVIVWPKGTGTSKVRVTNKGKTAVSNVKAVVTIGPGFTVSRKGGGVLKGRTLTRTWKSLGGGASATWTFTVKDRTGKKRCTKFPVVVSAKGQPTVRSTMVVCVRGVAVTG